ncbi:MAG: HDOD domain-containing protein [Gammaproteobacteria bacterium]|nr:HDOD domain-containing protein [Gammaproteobacteria bacterium]
MESSAVTQNAQATADTGSDTDLALLQRILGDAKNGRLRLPSLPDLAHKVRTAVNDPRRSVGDIARLVQFDPALAARLIQIANSPLYRGTKKFDNCHSAITRMGIPASRNLVVSFTVRNLFQARTPMLRERLQQTWQHSCRVAAISSVLARLTPGLDPDRALLAGLVHDIGILPLLQYIETLQIQLEPSRLENMVGRLRGALGTFVLKTWQFEQDIANIPAQAEDWERVSGEAIDYGDIVQVAHVHSQFGRGGYSGPPLTELKAFQKLSISKLGPGYSLELLSQSQQEINEVLGILQG